DSAYELPVKPSPNLPNHQSILLYPSVCFFEGTVVSVGRGTEFPFQVIGYPDSRYGNFTFTPASTVGAKNPPYENQICYGEDLRKKNVTPGIDLSYLIDFYRKSDLKEAFFTDYFKLLAGTYRLQAQIMAGESEDAIKNSWEPSLREFHQKREKYLLYSDFTVND